MLAHVIHNETTFYCWQCEARCQPPAVGFTSAGRFVVWCDDCKRTFTAQPLSAPVPAIEQAPATRTRRRPGLFVRLAWALAAGWRWAR